MRPSAVVLVADRPASAGVPPQSTRKLTAVDLLDRGAFLGVLIDLIAEGKEITERRVRDAAAAQAQFDDRLRSVQGTGGGAADGSKRPSSSSTPARSRSRSSISSRPRRWRRSKWPTPRRSPAADATKPLVIGTSSWRRLTTHWVGCDRESRPQGLR